MNATKAGVGQFSIRSLLSCQLVSARRLCFPAYDRCFEHFIELGEERTVIEVRVL